MDSAYLKKCHAGAKARRAGHFSARMYGHKPRYTHVKRARSAQFQHLKQPTVFRGTRHSKAAGNNRKALLFSVRAMLREGRRVPVVATAAAARSAPRELLGLGKGSLKKKKHIKNKKNAHYDARNGISARRERHGERRAVKAAARRARGKAKACWRLSGIVPWAHSQRETNANALMCRDPSSKCAPLRGRGGRGASQSHQGWPGRPSRWAKAWRRPRRALGPQSRRHPPQRRWPV